MKKLNVKELMEDLNVGLYGEEFEQYNYGYIYDIINDIADSNTPIYYYQINDFMINNIEWVERAIDEFGWDGDLHKSAQLGEYLKIQEDVYNNLDDVLLNYAYKYYMDNYSDVIDEDINNELEAINFNRLHTLDKINDIIDDLMKRD